MVWQDVVAIVVLLLQLLQMHGIGWIQCAVKTTHLVSCQSYVTFGKLLLIPVIVSRDPEEEIALEEIHSQAEIATKQAHAMFQTPGQILRSISLFLLDRRFLYFKAYLRTQRSIRMVGKGYWNG